MACGGAIDYPSRLQHDGVWYLGVNARDLALNDDDLRPIGSASSMPGDIASPTLYEINGIDPAVAVVMKGVDGSVRLFIRPVDGVRIPKLRDIPGVCVYAQPSNDFGCP